MDLDHRRTYELPGVKVTFSVTPELGLRCLWDPEMPQFTCKKRAERFAKRYRRAKRDFMQEVAQLLDQSILDVEIAPSGELIATEVKPGRPH